jgi:hypothetical protein
MPLRRTGKNRDSEKRTRQLRMKTHDTLYSRLRRGKIISVQLVVLNEETQRLDFVKLVIEMYRRVPHRTKRQRIRSRSLDEERN